MSGTYLPEDWELPEPWEAWAREKRPDLDIKETAEIFKDHWLSTTKNPKKRNWFSTWKNWVRRTNENSSRIHSNQAVPEPFLETLRTIADAACAPDLFETTGSLWEQMDQQLPDTGREVISCSGMERVPSRIKDPRH